MEKRAVVQPGRTPDTEQRIKPGVKNASANAQTRQLDDDFTKRAADAAANKLK